MVLSAYECSVVTELLSGLTEGDRIQLAKTVSKKIIKVVNADSKYQVRSIYLQVPIIFDIFCFVLQTAVSRTIILLL